MKEQLLKIADHYILIDKSLNLSENYRPFLIDSIEECSGVICSIFCEDNVLLPTVSPSEKSSIDESQELTISHEEDGSHRVLVKEQDNGKSYNLYATSDWSQVSITRACLEEDCPSAVINKFIMIAFIYASSYHQTVLLHASCVRVGKNGMAFIGQSGAGKSTHSRLWLKYVDGSVLMNDDQPAVRVDNDGSILIYGTPWSGKTPCYKSEHAVLKGLFRMVQAPYNRITLLSPVFLFRELLSSCSMMKSEPDSFKKITSTLAKIASSVSGFILENRPEEEAVAIAFKKIFNKKLENNL